MHARFHDGLTATPHDVTATAEGDFLVFESGGSVHRWKLADIEAEPLGDAVRLGCPDQNAGRLIVGRSEWAAIAPPPGAFGASRREVRLILWLAATAGALAAVVFIGVPLASGPLARHTPVRFEEQMGRNFETQLEVALRPCNGPAGQAALQALGTRLNRVTDTPFRFRVQAVEAPMANAFALPGGAIMVTDDLIAMTRTPDELSAVIAHEAAHVEQRHVIQAVWRSLGLGMVLDAVVGGGSGAGQQAVLLAGSITDLRYSRAAEAEADARGQALLRAAGLSSTGMAPFFRRLAAKGRTEQTEAAVEEWLSSHPDSLRRADLAQARGLQGPPAFSPAQWRDIKAACSGGPAQRFRFGWR